MESSNTIPPETSKKKSNFIMICKAVVALSIVCFLAYFVYEAFRANSKSTLKVDLGGYIVEVDINNDYVEINSIISKLFETETNRITTQALLREYYKLYDINDPQLIEYIKKIDQQAFLAEELRELLIELKGPFKRGLHSFHDVTNTEIATAIKDLGYSHPVAEALRKLLKRREGPFEEIEKVIEVRLSANKQLKAGYASACRKNSFFGKEIRVFNEARNRSSWLYVNNAIPHCTGVESETIIEVSKYDLISLVGELPDDTASYKAIGVMELQ